MISEPEVLSGPAVEPVSVAELKSQLRIDHTDEDTFLGDLVTAARQRVESYTRLALIERQVRTTYPHFGSGLPLPVWPVRSVDEIAYTDSQGGERTLEPSRWTLVKARPRTIVPAYGDTWPTTLPHWNAVRVTATIGFGAAADDVPWDLRQAVRIVAATLYEHREAAVVGTIASELPGIAAAEALMQPHVFWFVSQ